MVVQNVGASDQQGAGSRKRRPDAGPTCLPALQGVVPCSDVKGMLSHVLISGRVWPLAVSGEQATGAAAAPNSCVLGLPCRSWSPVRLGLLWPVELTRMGSRLLHDLLPSTAEPTWCLPALQNLASSVDQKGLYDTFMTFGKIISCKIATDPGGNSKGHGFVQFEDDASMNRAIEAVNGKEIEGQQVGSRVLEL